MAVPIPDSYFSLMNRLVDRISVLEKSVSSGRMGGISNGGLNMVVFDQNGLTASNADGPVAAWSISSDLEWLGEDNPADLLTGWSLFMTGYVRFPKEAADIDYTIYCTHNDGAVVKISAATPINRYSAGRFEDSGAVSLGEPLDALRPITIYYYFAGDADAPEFKLEWESANTPREVIPARALYHETPIWIPFGVSEELGGPIGGGGAWLGSFRNKQIENPCFFRKLESGLVQLRGVPDASSGNDFFRLPIGYRPSEVTSMRPVSDTGGGNASVEIFDQAYLRRRGGTGNLILNGVEFYAFDPLGGP